MLDATGVPVEERSLVRDAVSIAALCEVAEEAGAESRAGNAEPANRASPRLPRRARRRERAGPTSSRGAGVKARRPAPCDELLRDVRARLQAAAELTWGRMEGGFPFGGDPEDLMRSLREFAEQQAETVQEAQREQFATLTLNTAVELTAAALAQVHAGGGPRSRRRAARRDARALPRGRRARQRGSPGLHARGLLRLESPGREPGRLRDRSPASGGAEAGRAPDLGAATSPARSSTTRYGSCVELNAEGKLATIDVLGEEITRPDEARAIARAYREASTRSSAAARLERQRQADRARAEAQLRPLPREPRRPSSRTRPSATTSSGSTWRTPPRPTTRCGSTASCGRPGTRTSASSSRRG